MLKVFFIVLFFLIILYVVLKKQSKVVSMEDDSAMQNNLVHLVENKNIKQKFLANVYGVLHLKHNLTKLKKVVYPIKTYMSFINKNLKIVDCVDKKICQSKLTFRSYKNTNIAENIANLCVFSLLFKNKCDILQIINNYKLKYNLLKREVLFVKYYVLEVVLNWQIRYFKELFKMQKLVLLGKQYGKRKIKTELQKCEPFIYGIAKFNKNSSKIFIVNNIDVSGCVKGFLRELKEYDDKIKKLTCVFEIVSKDLKLS